MNFSELKPQIYSYLGFKGVGESAETDELIDAALKELCETARFRYVSKTFTEPPEFLLKEPYLSFLHGSSGVILSVMTLGTEIDRRIKFYGRTDMVKSVVFDACASAYLEYLSDEHEKTLGDNLTYRFCPGYGGSSIKDVRYIFELLKPEKTTGVTLTETGYMLPFKSMAGIIGIGKKAEKTCADCVLLPHCTYRKEGRTCYSSANK